MDKLARVEGLSLKHRFSNVRRGGFFFARKCSWRKIPVSESRGQTYNAVTLTLYEPLIGWFEDDEEVEDVRRGDRVENVDISIMFELLEASIDRKQEDARLLRPEYEEIRQRREECAEKMKQILAYARDEKWVSALEVLEDYDHDVWNTVPREVSEEIRVRAEDDDG